MLFRSGILNFRKERELSQKYFEGLNVKAPGSDTLLGQLSGGNQQKVVLGKWIAREPQILILDEPTRGIDVGAKYETYKIIVDLARQGKGIIMISSELPELLSMADRIMVISDQKIRGTLSAEEATQQKVMELSALSESSMAQ